ncbi:hypothetical protein [Komagataeibacter swingsii]|uniref:hypothetical protein n=1 Tax=Komagataeibacter swingsii TaxID=215220 RepID=UPI0011B401AF|nr:hypothetical protein [Komagataeibacter swingsii]
MPAVTAWAACWRHFHRAAGRGPFCDQADWSGPAPVPAVTMPAVTAWATCWRHFHRAAGRGPFCGQADWSGPAPVPAVIAWGACRISVFAFRP